MRNKERGERKKVRKMMINWEIEGETNGKVRERDEIEVERGGK